MKIGILTFHRAVNYGAVLQAIALYKTLRNLGVECELVEYQYASMNEKNSFLGRLQVGGIKKGVEYLLISKNKKNRRRKMRDFLEKHARMSNEFYTIDTIKRANNEYDKFIVGSDQMWNLKKTKNDYNFFLDFVNEDSKKYSYAVSVGDIDDNTRKVFGKYLQSFKAISVREINAFKEVYENFTDIVERHLDPTFLLTKKEWTMLAKRPKENKYILVYTLAKSKELLDFARRLSKKTGLRIINISCRAEIYNDIKKVSDASVEEFLGYFMCADYVVTNSFHGTAFSILMEKEFFVGYHKNEEMGNSRMETLLDVLKLENRAIDYDDKKINLEKVNYELAQKIIKEERKKSLQYLSNIVND